MCNGSGRFLAKTDGRCLKPNRVFDIGHLLKKGCCWISTVYLFGMDVALEKVR